MVVLAWWCEGHGAPWCARAWCAAHWSPLQPQRANPPPRSPGGSWVGAGLAGRGWHWPGLAEGARGARRGLGVVLQPCNCSRSPSGALGSPSQPHLPTIHSARRVLQPLQPSFSGPLSRSVAVTHCGEVISKTSLRLLSEKWCLLWPRTLHLP